MGKAHVTIFILLSSGILLKRPRLRTSKKLTPIAYCVLALYVCIFFVTVWFSSYQNKIVEEVREELEPHRKFLVDEIAKLEMQDAELTSIERIHQIAKKLNMIQPTEPAQILQDDNN